MLYEILIIIATAALHIASPFNKKVSRLLALRQGEIERVERFFRKTDNRERKTLWFHAASAGEFEQAKPIIEQCRINNPDYRIIASFFSPSGYEAGVKYHGIDFCFNLPFDRAPAMRRLTDAIRPHALIYAKYDVWTNLTRETHRQGAKLAMISATVPAQSLRYRFPLRYFFRASYALLDRIYAISDHDSARFRSLLGGECGANVLTTGDTKFDRIMQTIRDRGDSGQRIIQREPGILYWVAGSTYIGSERILLRALQHLRQNTDTVRLALVPHEVDTAHIDRLCRLIEENGLQPIRFSAIKPPILIGKDQVLVVDAMGILAFLYQEADLVFVGGSFKGSVHNIAEPVVFGKPVFTGPYIGNAHEALELSRTGGLVRCTNQRLLYRQMALAIDDPGYWRQIAETGKNFFFAQTGATRRIMDDLALVIG